MAASSKTASAPSETKLVQELADILDKSGVSVTSANGMKDAANKVVKLALRS